MLIKKADLTGTWPFKVPIIILCLYFFIYIPALRIFLRGIPFFTEYGFTCFYAAVIPYLYWVHKASPNHLGFSSLYLRQHLTVGAVLGGSMILALPLLSGLVTISGLGESEIFKASEGIPAAAAPGNLPVTILTHGLLIPVIEQIFFTGFVAQSFLKKFNPVIAVYLCGFLYSLAHFQLTLGTFAVGIITAWLFMQAGTLFAPLLFHIGCALSGLLLTHIYPRLFTLVGFLF